MTTDPEQTYLDWLQASQKARQAEDRVDQALEDPSFSDSSRLHDMAEEAKRLRQSAQEKLQGAIEALEKLRRPGTKGPRR